MSKYILAILILASLPFCSCRNGVSTNSGEVQESAGGERLTAPTIEFPARDTILRQGGQLHLRYRLAGEATPDSCVLQFGARRIASLRAFDTLVSINQFPVGVQPIRLHVWREGARATTIRKVTVLAQNPPQRYGFSVIKSYPHDETAYTQGLLFEGGKLYESTGQRGESTIRRVILETGEVEISKSLDNKYFGEGLALHNDYLYQLTWTSGVGFVYSLDDLTPVSQVGYSTQGWGLVSDGTRFFMSDGSENIYILNPNSFTPIRTLQAYDNLGAQEMLNELELIEGLLYANVFPTDKIVAIDTATGEIVKRIDIAGLLEPKYQTQKAEMLNGIAYDRKGKRIFLTGKYWPRLYHVEFREK